MFHFSFVTKRLVYIEFRVFRKEKKKIGGVEKAQSSYWPFAGLGRDRGFLCRDRVFLRCVATWFSVS